MNQEPGDVQSEVFFDVLRAILFYIDKFPERQHHPEESNLLFPKIARVAPETLETIRHLEVDHDHGEQSVRALQHQLIAWEVLGEPRRTAFESAARAYVAFCLEPMRIEEEVILPAAERGLDAADWHELDAAFGTNHDPLKGRYPRDEAYNRLFTRIVMKAPAPIGLGPQPPVVGSGLHADRRQAIRPWVAVCLQRHWFSLLENQLAEPEHDRKPNEENNKNDPAKNFHTYFAKRKVNERISDRYCGPVCPGWGALSPVDDVGQRR